MDTARRSAVDPERGLSAADVAERVANGEVNRVPAAPTRTVGHIVRSNVFTRFNALLGAMLALILVVGPLQDALFGVVLVANTLIGIVQELRAKRTLDRLTLLTAPTATVVRDGSNARARPPVFAVTTKSPLRMSTALSTTVRLVERPTPEAPPLVWNPR